MSSSPIAPTSTTGSSTSSRSESRAGPRTDRAGRSDPRAGRTALVACGALAQPAEQIAARRGWPLDVHPLPPLLHNQPERIAAAVREVAGRLGRAYERVVIGYADCGTYGALDEVCAELGVERLPGLHCYDVFAGPERVAAFFADQPGTYLLTDFLARSFERTVIRELGLDRWPDLRDTYFGAYTRMVWLAQDPSDPELLSAAQAAADRVGLPLTVLDVGYAGLEAALEALLTSRTAGGA